jgi:hypothetical protein
VGVLAALGCGVEKAVENRLCEERDTVGKSEREKH